MKSLSDLGEREAIRRILNHITPGTTLLGDDCAVHEFQDDFFLLTTDMITRKTHIPSEMTAYHIGWFVVAINLSDIAAKGGEPLGVLLSLGLPVETSTTFFDDIIRGADDCATTYDTTIIGGDTKENNEITLCGTAFGRVKKNEFLPRRGAQSGDIVAVTGCLGKAGVGYVALQQKNMDPELLQGLFKPFPRIKEGRSLALQHCISTSIDISDGLSSSLYQLMEINDVGFEITKEQLPVTTMMSRISLPPSGISQDDVILHFGGDYELLVTLPAEKFTRVQSVIEKTGGRLTQIGSVTQNKECVLIDEGKTCVLENHGYEHFKKHFF